MVSKRLTVLGGPNGAGKSTAFAELCRLGFVTGTFLNPDDIARELGGDPHTRDLRAGRETLRLARSWIEEGRTFTRESTLTGNEIVRNMRTAHDAGYRVVLVFVGVDSVVASKARVEDRLLSGGYDIPIEAQERRFTRSLENAPRAARIADAAYFVDNRERLRLVASVDCGQVQFFDASLARWVEGALEGLPRHRDATLKPRARALMEAEMAENVLAHGSWL